MKSEYESDTDDVVVDQVETVVVDKKGKGKETTKKGSKKDSKKEEIRRRSTKACTPLIQFHS
jgi:hypothetical protein